MSLSTEVRIALVFQQAEGSAALRTALANAGVVVAAEMRADAIDPAALEGAGIDAIVVNLDPELEELLDEVTERLDGLSHPVIYNDPAASSDLSGWDRARWLRHLSAKIKGGGSLVPPPPPGAQPVPMPPPRVPDPAKLVAAPAAVVPVAVADAKASPADDQMARPAAAGLASGDRALDRGLVEAVAVDAPDPNAVPVAQPSATAPVDDLAALFDLPPEVELVPPPPAAAPATKADADLDALLAAAPLRADGDAASVLADLDSLFPEARSAPAGERAVPPASAPVATPAVEAEIDLRSLLGDFDLDQTPDGSQVASPAGAPTAEWRLDEDSLASPAGNEGGHASTPRQSLREEEIPPHGADLDDLDALFAEAAVAGEAVAQTVSEVSGLDDLDLGSVDLESVVANMPSAGSAEPSEGETLATADFDFGFDLEPLSDVPSAPAVSTGVDPLDALLFGAPGAATAGGTELSLPDLDRLYVLGGSIGGPEAMKAFLARLPVGVPAAFVIAQHLGAEFLQMMAAQLDAATALSVRFPRAGERLRHGEVVVAPSDQRLRIDGSGHIELLPLNGTSPYRPSIDQLVSDAIERFGDRVTLILFSGMGSDGLEGARQLIARGGQVWVQERSSCVVASMIEGVKRQGLVRFEGSPKELAERVLEVTSC